MKHDITCYIAYNGTDEYAERTIKSLEQAGATRIVLLSTSGMVNNLPYDCYTFPNLQCIELVNFIDCDCTTPYPSYP